MNELLLVKEEGITGREHPTMADWFLAASLALSNRDRELGKIAEEILVTGLRAEHWFALLHEDPAQRTQSQVAELNERDRVFAAARKKFSDYMRRRPNEPPFPIERPNAP